MVTVIRSKPILTPLTGRACVFGVLADKPGHMPDGNPENIRWWMWTRAAFHAPLAEIASGKRVVKLLIDHEPRRSLMANTRDKSLVLWADKWGLNWKINANTERGNYAVEWLRSNGQYRSVSMAGISNYHVRLLGRGRDEVNVAEVFNLELTDLSVVKVPAIPNIFTCSITPRRSTMPTHQETPVDRVLRAVASAEAGMIQFVHVSDEAIRAATSAGLIARGSGRLRHALTAKGHARLKAGGSIETTTRPAGRHVAGRSGGLPTMHF